MDLSEDSQVILGYDWLHGHNPTIDWKKGTCNFDSCSRRCLERWDPNLGKGDKLFAMNIQGYLKKGEPWSIGKTRKPKQILEYPQRYLAHQRSSVKRNSTNSHQGGLGITALS